MPSPSRQKLGVLFLMAVLCVLRLCGQDESQAAKKPRDFSGEAYVIEQSIDQVRFENDGSGSRHSMARIRIQSDAGVQRYGLLVFPYQKASETVDIDFVRVRKPDGAVVTTSTDEVQDMPANVTREAPFYSDLHEKHLAVKGLSPGDVLEFQARWNVAKSLAPGQFWSSFTFLRNAVVLEQKVEMSVPRDRQVKVKSPALAPVISEEGPKRLYTWTRSNLEPESPHEPDLVQLAARGRFPPPDIQLSSFQTWEELGRWYDALQRERIAPSAEIRAKAAELTRTAATADAKLRAIYKYVSTEFRYFGVGFGVGRYQPHFASEVLTNQYGDCKDKHTLLASLLSAVGIPAYPALISSARLVDPDVVSPSQFDHLITVVPRDKILLFLDSTAEVAPFGYLPPLLRDKQALIVFPDKGAVLQATPVDAPFPGSWVFKIDAKLDSTGTLEGKVDLTVRGDAEVRLREALRSLPRTQWKDLIQGFSYSLGFAGDVSDATASMPEATEEPLHFAYTYKRKDYPDWQNRRISAPAPGVLPLLAGPDDKLPQSFWLGTPGEFNFESRVALPQGYTPELPGPKDLLQEFLEYHATYAFEDNVLVARYRIVLKKREVSGKAVKDYKAFAEKVMEDRNRYIPLAAAEAQAESPSPMVRLMLQVSELPDSSDPKAMGFEQDANAELRQSALSGAVEAYKRAVTQDPKFTRGWIYLAQLYTALQKQDLALEAFHQAIESDPQQPLSYKLLASTLASKEKLSEAIQVWQDLAKAVPDDRDVPGTLGALLIAEKRYGDAIPYLESTVKMNPKKSAPLIALATAYLRSGNDEKSSALFETAIQLEPGANTKNNIAWELAVVNKHLENALRYAQEAVHDEEESSQKVELEKLALSDLRHPNLLASYWDTLGWVHFRLGNLKQAESYLNASWRLLQGAISGYHLGQVYEKQQRVADAVHTYRLVTTLSPRSPDDREALSEAKKSLTRLKAPQVVSRLHPLSYNLAGELSDDRTVRLPKLAAKHASAEFFVVFSPGPRVEGTKFISGSDELRSAGKALSQARFKVAFPEKSSGRLLRRGFLGCYPMTGCSFVLMPTESVTSVN